jgi:hypothetical protein
MIAALQASRVGTYRSDRTDISRIRSDDHRTHPYPPRRPYCAHVTNILAGTRYLAVSWVVAEPS